MPLPPVPAGLKHADIVRFANRANQLEKHKPAIAYWCVYHIVEQVLGKKLHLQDKECANYTGSLMDKLEEMKNAHPTSEEFNDEVAAKAYVEQFALDVFQRADNAVRANNVTAQTADTFNAARTFLDVLGIWGPLDQELAAKSKYAKYHAVRIMKAINAGEDPNASNPHQDPDPQQEAPPLDPNDPEVQLINQSRQPTVEDATDDGRPSPVISAARASPLNIPSAPSNINNAADVSPIAPSPISHQEDGYFPSASIPTFTSQDTAPQLPTAPEQHPQSPNAMDMDPQNFYAQGPPSAAPTQPSPYTAPPPAPYVPPQPPQPVIPQFRPQHQHQAPMVPSAPPAASVPDVHMSTSAYNTDEQSVASAQKHAKWAISALAFEDVPTAVKELRIALQALGAS